MKSVFAHKKRLWQIHWMLRCIRIKHDMNGSRVKRRRNLKGYKVRGESKKKENKKKMQKKAQKAR